MEPHALAVTRWLPLEFTWALPDAVAKACDVGWGTSGGDMEGRTRQEIGGRAGWDKRTERKGGEANAQGRTRGTVEEEEGGGGGV